MPNCCHCDGLWMLYGKLHLQTCGHCGNLTDGQRSPRAIPVDPRYREVVDHVIKGVRIVATRRS